MTKQVSHGASEHPDLILNWHGKPQAVTILSLAVNDSLAYVGSDPSLLAGRLRRDLGRELSGEKPCLMLGCFEGLRRPFKGRVLTDSLIMFPIRGPVRLPLRATASASCLTNPVTLGSFSKQ